MASEETRIRAEHRHLDALFAAAREAFAVEGSLDAARARFAEIREAMEAHFDREDHLYYPVIWKLRPARKPALLAFGAVHREYLQRLEEIDAHLSRSELAAAREIFGRLGEAFDQHEAAEERVLSELEQELDGER